MVRYGDKVMVRYGDPVSTTRPIYSPICTGNPPTRRPKTLILAIDPLVDVAGQHTSD
jgi:hypothetical protein